MLIGKDFSEYEIISMADGEKLERWGKYHLLRPDPQIIWHDEIDKSKADAIYYRSNKGGGSWQVNNKLPDAWQVSYKDLTFNVKLMGFKHTGIFPEQSVNWDFMRDKVKKAGRKVKVLNLFAYTGCATCALLKEAAIVYHVDSSKGMVLWAKENVKSCHLEDEEVHFITDDVIKFVQREIRRGNKYDAIIMDPPSFGRGSNKEVWSLEKDLFNLVSLCMKILVDDPLFFIINSYTASISPSVLDNIMRLEFKNFKGKITSGEIGLQANNGLVLPCGVYARYED